MSDTLTAPPKNSPPAATGPAPSSHGGGSGQGPTAGGGALTLGVIAAGILYTYQPDAATGLGIIVALLWAARGVGNEVRARRAGQDTRGQAAAKAARRALGGQPGGPGAGNVARDTLAGMLGWFIGGLVRGALDTSGGARWLAGLLRRRPRAAETGPSAAPDTSRPALAPGDTSAPPDPTTAIPDAEPGADPGSATDPGDTKDAYGPSADEADLLTLLAKLLGEDTTHPRTTITVDGEFANHDNLTPTPSAHIDDAVLVEPPRAITPPRPALLPGLDPSMTLPAPAASSLPAAPTPGGHTVHNVIAFATKEVAQVEAGQAEAITRARTQLAEYQKLQERTQQLATLANQLSQEVSDAEGKLLRTAMVVAAWQSAVEHAMLMRVDRRSIMAMMGAVQSAITILQAQKNRHDLAQAAAVAAAAAAKSAVNAAELMGAATRAYGVEVDAERTYMEDVVTAGKTLSAKQIPHALAQAQTGNAAAHHTYLEGA